MCAKTAKMDEVKQKLLARKRELEEILNILANEKLTDDQVQDLGDQVSSATSETLRNSLQNAEIEEYNRVLQALEALDQGSYGTCVDCGEPISEKRLQVYPDATRCIRCQEALER